jgi:hypothetical protein
MELLSADFESSLGRTRVKDCFTALHFPKQEVSSRRLMVAVGVFGGKNCSRRRVDWLGSPRSHIVIA